MTLKTISPEAEAQIENRREPKKYFIVKSTDRFARAAIKAGLAELEVNDEGIDRIFEEVAARFCKEPNKRKNGETDGPNENRAAMKTSNDC